MLLLYIGKLLALCGGLFPELRESLSEFRESFSEVRILYSELRIVLSELRISYSELRISLSEVRISYSELRILCVVCRGWPAAHNRCQAPVPGYPKGPGYW
jgi:hypothetical protein